MTAPEGVPLEQALTRSVRHAALLVSAALVAANANATKRLQLDLGIDLSESRKAASVSGILGF